MSVAKTLFQSISEFLELQADPVRAKAMEAYMKGHFSFKGVKAPICKEFFKSFWSTNKAEIKAHSQDLLKLLWDADAREYQYLGLEILRKIEKHLSLDDLDFIEWLICNKSWWDTADFLASHCIGQMLKSDKELQLNVTERYMSSDNMWLKRSAIIFQLFYKESTNKDLLFALILDTLGSKEFFINKASGWALRQYSKTDKHAVASFIDTYSDQLSGLTKREGSKYL